MTKTRTQERRTSGRWTRGRRREALLLCAVTALATLGAPAAASHNAPYAAMGTATDTWETAAAWADGAVYQFGGWTPDDFLGLVASAAIWKYDPATDSRTLMGATLPDGLWGLTAIATDDGIYLFGGLGTGPLPVYAANDRILRYDPASDTLAVLAATTTPSFVRAAGVWDGGDLLYLFGGFEAVAGVMVYESVAVRSFDRSTGAFSVLPAVLPVPSDRASAVWVGDRAVIFAGDAYTFFQLDNEPGLVLAYDPALGAVVVESVLVDRSVLWATSGSGTTAVWTGQYAYVFVRGGSGYQSTLRYDPALRQTRFMLAGMGRCEPPPLGFTCEEALPLEGAAVWDGSGHAYVMGEGGGKVHRYTPALDRPEELEDWLGTGVPDPGTERVETQLPHLPPAIGQACERLADAPGVAGSLARSACRLGETAGHLAALRG